MLIDFFTPEQTEAVVDAFHELSRHYHGEKALPRAAVRRNFVDQVLGPHSGVRVLVASEGGQVAALATVAILYPAPEERGQLFMKDLFVREGWRGRGVGEQLMRFLARYALAHDCVRFDWTAEAGNHGALAFYRRLQARPVPEKVYFRLTGDELAALAGAANA
jgi:GNAT superfamily N-acetyltransferase